MSSSSSDSLEWLNEFGSGGLELLSEEERREFRGIMASLFAPKLWTPFPNSPQEMAYHSEAHELYFGGAAGAGKTGLGIGLALTQHHRSLILRRMAVEVVEIVDQLKKFAGRTGAWKSLGYGGTMKVGDRIIEVSGCEHEDDKTKYQGRPHDLICLDEAPNFTRSQFRFISAWNRHEDPKKRCRILLPGNPPTTPEGRWIIEDFAPWIDPDFLVHHPDQGVAKPGELRWFTYLKDKLTWLEDSEPFYAEGERIVPRSRTFIPGRLADNPILAATDYGARLQALPEPLRSQLLYGDMLAGGEDDPWQCIPTDWVRKAMQRWTPNPPPDLPMTCVGVDCARGGKAKTVISRRYGPWFAPLKKWPGTATPDGPSLATLVIREHRDEAVINIDVIGIGASGYDVLKEQRWLKVVPVNNAGKCSHTDRSGKLHFVNIRAASYWRLREALDPDGGERVMLPPDNELLADLTSVRYKVLASGIQLEAKDDIAERIGRSPDCGDAVVLAEWGAQARAVGEFRILRPRPKTVGLHIYVASAEDLAAVTLAEDEACLLVNFMEPTQPGFTDLPLNSSPRSHGCRKLLESTCITAADLSPKDYEAVWDEPLPRYGKTCKEVMFTSEHGKQLWRLLLKKRLEPANSWVFCDEGGEDTRAISAALAVCDTLRYPRPTTVFWLAGSDEHVEDDLEPGNRYLYDTVKSSRHLVVT